MMSKGEGVHLEAGVLGALLAERETLGRLKATIESRLRQIEALQEKLCRSMASKSADQDREPLTEWPGAGEEPPGLWELMDGPDVVSIGRFVIFPGEGEGQALFTRPDDYAIDASSFEAFGGDRFIPVDE